jgi:simple sugar transport system ATP-binding protein
MRGITKRFPPSTLALNNVDLSSERGEIHCLLGENGAGKTTLMNILYGLYSADKGEILFDGRNVEIHHPREAIEIGIGMVHQHFHHVPLHTVAENVALGLPGIKILSPMREVLSLIEKVSKQYGLEVDPKARIWQLSAGEHQRVEIIKVLCRDVRVLILDEPTSILTPQETETLFGALKKMVAEGMTVIFITHKLDEVMSLSQRVSVLRSGKMMTTVETSKTTKNELARMMVGRDVFFRIRKKGVQPGQVVLQVRSLQAQNDRGLPALKDVSFKIREKEIFGIAGVAGNGQKELIEVITGLRKASAGSVIIADEEVTNWSSRKIGEKGVSHIPEDRLKMGLVPDMTVAENLLMRDYKSPPYSKGLFISRKEVEKRAEELVSSYNIVTPSINTPAKLLSGGNIQRLILARELSTDPRLVVASHPTYGLDVGATEQIRSLLLKQLEKGSAILLVSEDLEEVITLSNRIAVMHSGRIIKTIDAEDADIEEIGLLMAGEDREQGIP